MDTNRIAVIGAGTMGTGIAQVCAVAGLNVIMIDVSDKAVQKGLSVIDTSLSRLVKKEKLSEDGKKTALSHITVSTEYKDVEGRGIIIEAATERRELKLDIIKKLDELVTPDTVIATNTSSISISELAAGVSTPDRFIGMHFFNPVPIMMLVEIVRGLQTSDETHAKAEEFIALIGKTPITAGNSPGFVVNRILCPMINEAIFTYQEGLASAEDIDKGMTLGCNHPIGPLALADLIGLDTMLAVMQVFYEGFNDPKYRPATLLKEMVAAGYLGRKSGRGFYEYE